MTRHDPEEIERFDALIVGAGQAGKPLAVDLARAGWTTALIERTHIGGTCINEGCTPTKTMVASARVAALARRAADYGVVTGPVRVDQSVVRGRKRAIVENFRSGGETQIAGTANLELIRGEASFEDGRTLVVTRADGAPRRLTAERIVLNTGARPQPPALEGLDAVPWLDSTSIMELDTVPEHLIVIGGGYIGLEFGQMFHRFGSRVTIVQRGPKLLGREDDDVADAVARLLIEDGLDIRLGTVPRRVEPFEGGLRLRVAGPDGDGVIEGSHLLLAVGRTPNTERLNLAAAGLVPDARGHIPVDDRLETAVPGIFAAGDVNGGPSFTHVAYDDYRILRARFLEQGEATTRGRLVPYTVFIDPQLGRIGPTESEARAQAARDGRRIRVARIPMTWVARALESDDSRGFMKAIVDVDTDRILGAAVLGMEGGEVLAMLQLAMQGGLTAAQLRNTVFAHPTLSEGLNTLFGNWQE